MSFYFIAGQEASPMERQWGILIQVEGGCPLMVRKPVKPDNIEPNNELKDGSFPKLQGRVK